jgi:hypothetical protein
MEGGNLSRRVTGKVSGFRKSRQEAGPTKNLATVEMGFIVDKGLIPGNSDRFKRQVEFLLEIVG